MNIPTIHQFNAWSDTNKAWWIEYETDGRCKEMKANERNFPMILYNKENVAIMYKVDAQGNITQAFAITVDEALDLMERAERAKRATTSKAHMN